MPPRLAAALAALALAPRAAANKMPPGELVRVLYTGAPSTEVVYAYPVQPTVAGLYFVGFAFRQDPNYWYFRTPTFKLQGSATELFENANLRRA